MTKIYTVKNETSFEEIAQNFSVDVGELKAWNASRKGMDSKAAGYSIATTFAQRGFSVHRGDKILIPNRSFQTKASAPAQVKKQRNINGNAVTRIEHKTDISFFPSRTNLVVTQFEQDSIDRRERAGKTVWDKKLTIIHNDRGEPIHTEWHGTEYNALGDPIKRLRTAECYMMTVSELQARRAAEKGQKYMSAITPEMEAKRRADEINRKNAIEFHNRATNPANPGVAIATNINTAAIAAHEMGFSPTKRIEAASLTVKAVYGFGKGALDSASGQKGAQLDYSDIFIDGATGAFDEAVMRKWNPIGKFVVIEGKEYVKAGVNNLQGDEARSATDITADIYAKAVTQTAKSKLKNSAAAKKTKDGIATVMTATFDTVALPNGKKGVRVPVISTGIWDPATATALAKEGVDGVIGGAISEADKKARAALAKCFDKNYILQCNADKPLPKK